jgi:flagellar hook-associated protein 2
MSRRLASLTSKELASSGPYRSLGDLGVRTERDGTLSLNTAKLDAALSANPEAVTQMLNPTVQSPTNPGIAGALKEVTDFLNGTGGPLAGSQATYEKLRTSLQKQLDNIGEDRSHYSEQLTKTYSVMQSQLLRLKSTQSYLDQQIKAWNSSGNN